MKMRTKSIFMLLALLVVFMSGCIDQKKEIVLDEPGNISNYEFEVFLDDWDNNIPANTTTYYILEDKTEVQVVHIVINSSKLEIYPPDTLGGGSGEEPIRNFVLLVEPANETVASPKTFMWLANSSNVSDLNYTLTQEIARNMKVINLEFEEPVTGFIAYTLDIPATQSFAFMKPDSEFIRVVLPVGFATGNRIFGIARPEPYDVSVDEEGRQTLLWISSKMGEREEAIQVKYYTESAPMYFFAAIVALLFGVGLVISRYSQSKKELESVREVFELEKEYEAKERRKKK
ncbi:TPA: hypothetical protein HA338_03215 [Methanosarcina acetivorans]|uniref:Uncharacterized protein n=3 Tax=Methanosarcina acetivorans TaxID=2214 RepID=Q8TTY1_METAC|nr:predicted protein [Methanosarcina acetivorans C2A]HIH93075.1 hypothetical protein [Methanosarcina acetivorans]